MVKSRKMESRWYTNPELLIAAREEFGSFQAIAREIGGADASTLSYWWRKLNLPRLPKGPQPGARVNEEALKRLHRKVYA
jgi:transposase-like protein